MLTGSPLEVYTLKVEFGNDEDGWSLANAVSKQLKANKIQINQSINKNPELSEHFNISYSICREY